MFNLIIAIICIILIIVIWQYLIIKRERFTLFSAHPNKLINIDKYEKRCKHIRLNNAGGPMYISWNPPTELDSCKCL